MIKFFKKRQTLLEKIEEIISLQREMIRHLKKHEKIVPHLYNKVYDELKKSSKIHEIYLTELFPGIENIMVPIGVINEASAHTNQVSMIYVVAIAKFLKSKRIFEFGTWIGKTTYYLSFASDNTTIFTLDLPPEQASAGENTGCYFRGTNKERVIKQIYCNSLDFDPSPYRKSMDLIFIDGGHTYKEVENDTLKAFEMLAPRGVIIWDDYEPKNPDIVKFLANFSQNKNTQLFHIRKTSLIVYIDGINAPISSIKK